jgi:serine/threonine-protein kinase
VPSAAPGELLAGKYRVERALGEGGMGVVVAATNVALNQRVAIKLLRPAALANKEALGRFLREARAAASLRSEHVARVLDVGSLADGRPYMVMEYLEGRDLGDLVEHGPALPIPRAVDYVLQACEAIAEAHAAGIIHRDLKPRNLFLTQTVDGRPLVKVLDFGISKMEGAPQDMQLTRTTEIIGSPSYMSPEQLRASRNVDKRTDIWALGVILYELLTQQLPFYASTVTELVAVVLTEHEPPVQSVRPDVPDALAAIIARCLAKKPDERFATVADLVSALEPYGTGSIASFSDRVRGVAAQSGKLPPATGSNPSLAAATRDATTSPGLMPTALQTEPPAAAPSSPSAVGSPAAQAMMYAKTPAMDFQGGARGAGVVPAPRPSHRGTGLVWGGTQGDAPPAPRASKTGLGAILGLAALLVVAAGGGGAAWYVNTKRAHADPPAGDMPLPSGRKDLPPLASATDSATAALTGPDAPPPAPSAPSAGTAPTGAPSHAASTKITTKPAAPARPTAPPPGTAKPPDDLNNIGRR